METISKELINLKITETNLHHSFENNLEHEDYSTIINVMGSIEHDNKEIGRINMKIIDGGLGTLGGYDVTIVCEDYSNDLRDVSLAFYENNNFTDKVINALGIIPMGLSMLYVENINLNQDYDNEDTIKNIIDIIKLKYDDVDVISFKKGSFKFDSSNNSDFGIFSPNSNDYFYVYTGYENYGNN